jgi:hypothetical protein
MMIVYALCLDVPSLCLWSQECVGEGWGGRVWAALFQPQVTIPLSTRRMYDSCMIYVAICP